MFLLLCRIVTTTRDATPPPGYHLSHTLLLADKSGRWLAQTVGTTDAQVSRWRKGMRPNKQMQHKIAGALSAALGRKITPTELGW